MKMIPIGLSYKGGRVRICPLLIREEARRSGFSPNNQESAHLQTINPMELEGIRWLSRGKPAGNFFEKIASLQSKISSRHHLGKRGFKHRV